MPFTLKASEHPMRSMSTATPRWFVGAARRARVRAEITHAGRRVAILLGLEQAPRARSLSGERRTWPQRSQSGPGPDETLVIECIEACIECAQACTACTDDSLAEPAVTQLIESITLCLDCAVTCEATRQVVMRQTERGVGFLRAQVGACAEACRVCSAECQRHAAHLEHHRICAEACHRCEAACDRLAEAFRI